MMAELKAIVFYDPDSECPGGSFSDVPKHLRKVDDDGELVVGARVSVDYTTIVKRKSVTTWFPGRVVFLSRCSADIDAKLQEMYAAEQNKLQEQEDSATKVDQTSSQDTEQENKSRPTKRSAPNPPSSDSSEAGSPVKQRRPLTVKQQAEIEVRERKAEQHKLITGRAGGTAPTAGAGDTSSVSDDDDDRPLLELLESNQQQSQTSATHETAVIDRLLRLEQSVLEIKEDVAELRTRSAQQFDTIKQLITDGLEAISVKISGLQQQPEVEIVSISTQQPRELTEATSQSSTADSPKFVGLEKSIVEQILKEKESHEKDPTKFARRIARALLRNQDDYEHAVQEMTGDLKQKIVWLKQEIMERFPSEDPVEQWRLCKRALDNQHNQRWGLIQKGTHRFVYMEDEFDSKMVAVKMKKPQDLSVAIPRPGLPSVPQSFGAPRYYGPRPGPNTHRLTAGAYAHGQSNGYYATQRMMMMYNGYECGQHNPY